MSVFNNIIYKVVSSVFYIVVGVLLIFTDVLMPDTFSYKKLLGVVIVAYGAFRLVTSFKAVKKDDE